MRRYLYSKQAQGDRYLRDRNLLVSPATLRLTEEIKLKARRNQVKEDAKRVLKSKHTFTITTRDRSTQTDNDQFNLLEEDDSDTSPEELIYIPDSVAGSYSIVTRAVTFCLSLLFTFITAIVIFILLDYYLRVYPVYSRL